MQFPKPLHDLRKDTPNLLLASMRTLLLVLDNFMAEVALARVFHNDAA